MLLPRKKVLIIDDEQQYTNMLQLLLEEKYNYEVRVENEARYALTTALEFMPDIILLDIIFPGDEGTEMYVRLQNQIELQRTPIVFLTAAVTHDEVEDSDGRIAGHIFLSKPVDVETLNDCISENIHTAR